MGRRKSVAQIQRELKFAQNLAAYKPPAREAGAASRRHPKITVAYKLMATPPGLTALKYAVQASKAGVLFFGQTELGVPDAAAEEKLPRGAKPARVHAMVSDNSPNIITALGSKRSYTRYGSGNRGGGTQYTYTAPISIQSSSAIEAEVKAAYAAVKSKLGGPYGRTWFSPEIILLTGSGE